MHRSRKKQQNNILIIDDNPDQWTLIRAVIEKTFPQINAVWVATSQATIEYLDECTANYQALPKLILLDLYLPLRDNGFQLLQELKSNASIYKYPPVVVLSSSSNSTDIQEAYVLGCSSYLVKPATLLQWQELFNVVKTYWWDTVTVPSNR